MKNLLLLFLVTFTVTTHSQKINSGVIKYEFSYDLDSLKNIKNKQLYKRAYSMVNKSSAFAKDFEYTLKFNKNESLFTVDPGMFKGDDDMYAYYNLAVGLHAKKRYQNALKKYALTEQTGFDEQWVIKDSLYNDWKITSEVKIINNIYVVKAVKKSIVAWFAPSIPVPFGPAGYGGLPGMILELKHKAFRYKVAKIIKKNKDIKVINTLKGKLIDRTDFLEVEKKWKAEMKPYYKKG